MNEQPTLNEKRDTLRGRDTGRAYSFPPPPVSTAGWDDDAWIRFIGDRWYRKNSQRKE